MVGTGGKGRRGAGGDRAPGIPCSVGYAAQHRATAGEWGAQGGGGGSCAPRMVPDCGIPDFLPRGHALLGTGHECAWEAAPETQASRWDCPLARWGEGPGFQTTLWNQNLSREEGRGLPGPRQGAAPPALAPPAHPPRRWGWCPSARCRTGERGGGKWRLREAGIGLAGPPALTAARFRYRRGLRGSPVSAWSEAGTANVAYSARVFKMLPFSPRQCDVDFSIYGAKRLGAKG